MSKKSVYKKLFSPEETNLKSQKVELNTIKDLEKAINKVKFLDNKDELANVVDIASVMQSENITFINAKRDFESRQKVIKSLITKFDKNVSIAESELTQVAQDLGQLLTITTRLQKQAKELGVNANTLPKYQEAVSAYDEGIDIMKYVRKEITKISSEIKKAKSNL